MRKIIALLVCILVFTGCTESIDDNATVDNTNQELYITIDELQEQLELSNNENVLLGEEVERLIEERLELSVEVEELKQEKQMLNEEIAESISVSELTQIQIDELLDIWDAIAEPLIFSADIPISEYTIAELADRYAGSADGVGANDFGNNVSWLYIELGLEEFVKEISELADEEDVKAVASIFASDMFMYGDIYYTNTFDQVIFLNKLKTEFFGYKESDISDEEIVVVDAILEEIDTVLSWIY